MAHSGRGRHGKGWRKEDFGERWREKAAESDSWFSNGLISLLKRQKSQRTTEESVWNNTKSSNSIVFPNLLEPKYHSGSLLMIPISSPILDLLNQNL